MNLSTLTHTYLRNMLQNLPHFLKKSGQMGKINVDEMKNEKKYLMTQWVFCMCSKNAANFDSYLLAISASINNSFLKSDISTLFK